MGLLPAVVPDIPENRADVAAARLARKIAPLFGVSWPEGPFGTRSWVCDYSKVTLTEIARGAPLPTRAQAARLDQPADGTWDVVERIGVTGRRAALPNEIANATLNRFGPDTHAAAVLTAVNSLLAPVQDAARTALSLLVDAAGQPLPPQLRLAAWAGLVVEVFRSQPALVAAGIHARAIQQELVETWHLPLAAGLEDLPLTRCEVDPVGEPVSASGAPWTLDIADATFGALDLDGAQPDQHDPDADFGPSALAGRLRHDESVDLLLRRLLAAGTHAESSYLWMSERVPGQLAVEALLPPTAVVDRFVQNAARSLGVTVGPDGPPVLPAVPEPARLAGLPVLARRATVIGLLTVLRHIQHSPAGREQTRRVIVPALQAVAELARQVLDQDDPVAALTTCRVADMTVQTLRPDLRKDLRAPLRDLVAGLDRCEDLLRRGLLDRGSAAEAISSACVELNVVARTNARRPEAGLPSADELRDRVRRGWSAFHEALELRSSSSGVELPTGLAGYHLHNYAAFLAGSTEHAELLEAVTLFRDVVLPAREEFLDRSGHFLPLRNSLQVGSRATTRLGEDAMAAGDAASARMWAALGRDWINRALRAEETRRLLAAPPTENACRFALLAAPALLLAVEAGVAGALDDVLTAASLVDIARRWEEGAVDGGEHHTRNDEVVALAARIKTLAPSGPAVRQGR